MQHSLPLRSVAKQAKFAPSTIDIESTQKIEAWNQQATEALAAVAPVSPPRPMRGTTTKISIPLDESARLTAAEPEAERQDARAPTTNAYGRREIMRRDSLKRREALLKGKEGSRRRNRHDNSFLLSNPWREPPEPSDWLVGPAHHQRAIPYFLAPLWDEEKAQKKRAEERRKRFHGGMLENTDPAIQVPKEVRARLKRARAAKGLLQDLEEDVRVFLERWNDKQVERKEDGLDDIDSEEDEVVFVGRNGQMHDSPSRQKGTDGLGREKLVFDALAEDRSAGFGRWLVHSIATYYGLRTWSITVGDPARREAYVGISEDRLRPHQTAISLPRPLWGMV